MKTIRTKSLWPWRWLRRKKEPRDKNDNMLLQLVLQLPDELQGLILVAAGPQTAAALVSVNRQWNAILNQQEFWRLLCQSYHKWQPGRDKEPVCWKAHYRQNPVIPIDYSSINAALRHQPVDQPLTIWMRPGCYEITRPICIRREVTIQGMLLSDSKNRCDSSREPAKVVLVYNSPLEQDAAMFRVIAGELTLNHLIMKHRSKGHSDIWRGNAAIHVQGQQDTIRNSTTTGSPRSNVSLVMNSCNVTSSSGRGIVVKSGATASVNNSYIHHCASAGIAVSGSASRLLMRQTDVVHNGTGNEQKNLLHKGHSGVVIVDCHASLWHCNVSLNMGAGISVLLARDFQDRCQIRNCCLVDNFDLAIKSARDDPLTISNDNQLTSTDAYQIAMSTVLQHELSKRNTDA